MVLAFSISLLVPSFAASSARAEELPKQLLLVASQELLPVERDRLLKSTAKSETLKDGTLFRRVDREEYAILIEERMLPDGYVAAVRRIAAGLHALADPFAPFDPNDPKNADLVAWATPGSNRKALASTPSVRFSTGRSFTLSGRGHSLTYPLDKDPELPTDAFPSEVKGGSLGPQPPVLVPTLRPGRHTYVGRGIRYRTELIYQLDLARFLAETWRKALTELEKQTADIDRAFDQERMERKLHEDPPEGTSFTDLDASTRRALDNHLVTNWESLGFKSLEGARSWLATSQVQNVRTRVFARYGGYDNGVRTTFHINVPWP